MQKEDKKVKPDNVKNECKELIEKFVKKKNIEDAPYYVALLAICLEKHIEYEFNFRKNWKQAHFFLGIQKQISEYFDDYNSLRVEELAENLQKKLNTLFVEKKSKSDDSPSSVN